MKLTEFEARLNRTADLYLAGRINFATFRARQAKFWESVCTCTLLGPGKGAPCPGCRRSNRGSKVRPPRVEL